MKAAVVEAFDRPPVHGDFALPASLPGTVSVSVRGAALSQLVRAQAAGRHYTSATPPFVPGADGVGTLEDGRRVYFAFPESPVGAMAEQVVVASEHIVALPESLDDMTAAAIANPGMSSWAALTRRAAFKPGETVLVHGATGDSGRLAIGIARHLGARRVIATGRRAEAGAGLIALGADAYVCLSQEADDVRAQYRALVDDGGIDVVLDYLWGPPAATLMDVFTGHGPAASPAVRWVNIGSLAGAEIPMPAGRLRSSGIALLGSGIGSVSNAELVAAIGEMFTAIEPAGLSIDAKAQPLSAVAEAWEADISERLVFVP